MKSIENEMIMDETDIVDNKFKQTSDWIFAHRSNNKNNENLENNKNKEKAIKQKKLDFEYQQKLIEFEKYKNEANIQNNDQYIDFIRDAVINKPEYKEIIAKKTKFNFDYKVSKGERFPTISSSIVFESISLIFLSK
jgi:hypothetical protein